MRDTVYFTLPEQEKIPQSYVIEYIHNLVKTNP